jgi:trimethylamine--corrinoid protein Co-methyltransferase
VLSDEGLALVEENADTILEQVGIEFRDAPDAIALLTDAGAEIDGERVRFPAGSRASSCRRRRRASSRSSRGTRAQRRLRRRAHDLRARYGSPFVRDLDGGAGTGRSRTSGTS